jgi:hypothetical protein
VNDFFHWLKRWRQNYSLGYFANQHGILQRFLREQGNWEPHLSISRQAILSEVDRLKPKTVAIFGSGWLLDVPLKELIEQGIRVKLFDIAHPTKLVNKYKGVESIEFIDFDLTFGAVHEVKSFLQKPSSFKFELLIDNIKNTSSSNAFNYDLVVSINTLSQLHAPFIDAFENRKSLSKYSLVELIEAFQTLHIKSLPKGKSLLITELYEEILDLKSKLQSESPRVYINLTGFEKVNEWNWQFDTQSTYIDDFSVRKRVGAYRV